LTNVCFTASTNLCYWWEKECSIR